MSAPRCTEAVHSYGAWTPHRCNATAKFDLNDKGVPTKCGTHCKEAKAKRQAKKDAETAKWQGRAAASRNLDRAKEEVETALRKIAEGHNDPRTLAQETIAALDAAIERAKW